MPRTGKLVKKDPNNPGKVIGTGRFVKKDPKERFKQHLKDKGFIENFRNKRKTKGTKYV